MYRLPAFKEAARQKSMKTTWYRGYHQIDKNIWTCCGEWSFEFGEAGSSEWSPSIGWH